MVLKFRHDVDYWIATQDIRSPIGILEFAWGSVEYLAATTSK